MDGDIGAWKPFTYHGGDVAAACAAFPEAPSPWLDLSTGINPVPYPVPPLEASTWAALPDARSAAALEAAAARAYGAEPAQVAAAPGTEALMQVLPRLVLPRLVPARRVGVLGFTYAGHASAWRAAGAAVEIVPDLERLAGRDVAIVVNPNNPDGRHIAAADLAELAGRVGVLVVDEAFADVLPERASLVPTLPRNAIVLRSFGKFFGLAGLRLGFAVAHGERARHLRGALGPWAVSGPAIAIGTLALGDAEWAAAARARLAADAARLDATIAARGGAIVGGTSLFRLAAVGDASASFATLARAGILTRPFEGRPRWLRFGLPADAAQWARLERALPKRLA